MLRIPSFCMKQIFNKILILSTVLEASQIGVLIRGYFIRLSSQPPSPLARAVALFTLLLPLLLKLCHIRI